MNKCKNVCLGRRGRPKKNQQKPLLSDYICALTKIEEFSFFPLNKNSLENGLVDNVSTEIKFKDLFEGWYNLCKETTNLDEENSMNNLENDFKDKIKISFNNDSWEVDLLINSGVFTNSSFMPYIIFVKGHIWKMAFSPPILSLKNIYLSIGTHPLNSPISQINKRYAGLGIIQIWEIPFVNDDENSSPILKYEIYHNGLICRFIEWVPLSENIDSNTIGFIFCVLGDGNAYIVSIPLRSMYKKINIESITIWKYSDSLIISSGSVCIPSNENTLRIAGTTVEGILLIWTFENDMKTSFETLRSKFNNKNQEFNKIIASEQLIPISQGIPLLSASWCPIYSSSLIVIGDNNGKVSIVDFRRCNNHVIKEFELPNRPITCIVWCRLTNNIYISHGIGAIVLTVENGDYTQFSVEAFIKKRKYSIYDEIASPILGSRSWTCSSMLHYAIFGFNDGSTIIGPCFEFESKSFQETLLIKTVVTNSDLDKSSSFNSNSKSDLSLNSEFKIGESNLFNDMKDLILRDFDEKIKKMRSGSIRILWEHDISNINIKDFLEVQCITSIDPFLYPQLINQSFVAIAYFGGLVAIHRFH